LIPDAGFFLRRHYALFCPRFLIIAHTAARRRFATIAGFFAGDFSAVIDLYYWMTPNGHKVTIFLEEAGLAEGRDYRIVPVDIGAGAQFAPDFLAVAPNNRIPAIVDHLPSVGRVGGILSKSPPLREGEEKNSARGGEKISGDKIAADSADAPVSVFESGAILIYLAEKYRRFLPGDMRARADVLQWLMWQMGGLGPMLGQNHHFLTYAPEKIPYAVKRYADETLRLYRVLNRRLAGRDYICGEYSVADMACYPWIVPHERQGIDITALPDLRRWFERIRARPAVIRAYDIGKRINPDPTMSIEAKKILFGQTDACAPSQ
jgi:GST-like protein